MLKADCDQRDRRRFFIPGVDQVFGSLRHFLENKTGVKIAAAGCAALLRLLRYVNACDQGCLRA